MEYFFSKVISLTHVALLRKEGHQHHKFFPVLSAYHRLFERRTIKMDVLNKND